MENIKNTLLRSGETVAKQSFQRIPHCAVEHYKGVKFTLIMQNNMYDSSSTLARLKCLIPLLCLLLLAGFNPSYGQESGNISGIVVDKTSGEELPFANVHLVGTSFGSATGDKGDYIIYQVAPGEYTLTSTYIGYQELSVPVTVVAGETKTINLELDYAAFEGDVVVVTAQASGQMSAINQQLNSSTITNVVSADRIKDVPDVNAAESVSRLPGLSLVRSEGEGQKVAVRGISPKYNVMMVNGVRMQSTDRNDRSVDLNMIAPNIL